MDSVVNVSALVKRFGSFAALDGFDLQVADGRIHGFLGPNGAGKSTAIRVLLGLYRANSGTVSVLGLDPFADAVKLHGRLAYVPGDVALWPRLTGGETIDLILAMRGAKARAARREEMIERFELDPTKRAGAYSKGNRQKVALVAALAADTELLILDEPTSGLDPLMAEQFRQCVRAAPDRGLDRIAQPVAQRHSVDALGRVRSRCPATRGLARRPQHAAQRFANIHAGR